MPDPVVDGLKTLAVKPEKTIVSIPMHDGAGISKVLRLSTINHRMYFVTEVSSSSKSPKRILAQCHVKVAALASLHGHCIRRLVEQGWSPSGAGSLPCLNTQHSLVAGTSYRSVEEIPRYMLTYGFVATEASVDETLLLHWDGHSCRAVSASNAPAVDVPFFLVRWLIGMGPDVAVSVSRYGNGFLLNDICSAESLDDTIKQLCLLPSLSRLGRIRYICGLERHKIPDGLMLPALWNFKDATSLVRAIEAGHVSTHALTLYVLLPKVVPLTFKRTHRTRMRVAEISGDQVIVASGIGAERPFRGSIARSTAYPGRHLDILDEVVVECVRAGSGMLPLCFSSEPGIRLKPGDVA